MVLATALIIWLIFLLPRVVVENESQLTTPVDAPKMPDNPHKGVPDSLKSTMTTLRAGAEKARGTEKSAIFADSLAVLYATIGQYDSAARWAEKAATFFNNKTSWKKAGEDFYQAYSYAMDPQQQEALAEKARLYLGKVLEDDPNDLKAKSEIALTWMSSSTPMKGIGLLREVLQQDPQNEFALYNMGMLSFQSGQYALAIQRLEDLIRYHPDHLQGQLLLGVAYLNTGNKEKARAQFDKVKSMDKDPAVQATVDSYLKDLK